MCLQIVDSGSGSGDANDQLSSDWRALVVDVLIEGVC